jgi:ABC-2 type transport system ATP-binding protein
VAQPPAIELRGLVRYFGERTALRKVSVQVPVGATLAVLGHNGAGKSTLLRILATLLRPHAGEVAVLGEPLPRRAFAVRGRIGLLAHEPLLYRDLNGRENLQYHARLHGATPERVEELLTAVGMDRRADEPVRLLSRGMVQRLAVCRAVLHRPEVLLLDEPSTGLDPAARIDMWRHLRTINERDGVTVLVTTHLMEEADRCSRLAIMQQGRLLACDTPAALKDRIGGDVITIASAKAAEVRSILHDRLGVEAQEVDGALRLERRNGHQFVPQLIEAAPGLVDSIAVGKPTLEDVFIQLTGQRFRDEM